MNTLTISLLAALGYSALFIFILVSDRNTIVDKSRSLSALALLPLLLHGSALYLNIETHAGQNLSFSTLFSLAAWFLVILILLHNIRHRRLGLLAFGLPVAVIGVLLPVLLPTENTEMLKGQSSSLWHIWLAVIAHSLFAVASLQSLLILLLDRRLRRQPGNISPLLPPMQSMNHLLFQLLWAGMLLLTLALIIGFTSLQPQIAEQPLHKLILSLLAWVVFAVLLFGHHRFGWRGNVAAKWTLAGFALLAVGYFGSRLVLDLILSGAR